MGQKRKQRIAERYRPDGQYATPSKKETRLEVKTDKQTARADLARAKAEKRKWLVFLLALILATYLLVSTGSLTKGLDVVKGIF